MKWYNDSIRARKAVVGEILEVVGLRYVDSKFLKDGVKAIILKTPDADVYAPNSFNRFCHYNNVGYDDIVGRRFEVRVRQVNGQFSMYLESPDE